MESDPADRRRSHGRGAGDVPRGNALAILFYNHTTGQWHTCDALRNLTKPGLLLLLPMLYLVWPSSPTGWENFIAPGLLAICYMIARSIFGAWRHWRFKAKWIRRLVNNLDENVILPDSSYAAMPITRGD